MAFDPMSAGECWSEFVRDLNPGAVLLGSIASENGIQDLGKLDLVWQVCKPIVI